MESRSKLQQSGGDPLPTAALLERTPLSRRLLTDRLARVVVRGGGIAIIASIMAILVVIVSEAWPLFQAPSAEPLSGAELGAGGSMAVLATDADEHRTHAWVVDPGGFSFAKLEGPLSFERAWEAPAPVRSVSSPEQGRLALGLADGRAVTLEVDFRVSFETGIERTVTPSMEAGEPVLVATPGDSLESLAYAATDRGPRFVALTADGSVAVLARVEKRSLLGGGGFEDRRTRLELSVEGRARSVAIEPMGRDAFVGTSAGELVRIDLRKPDAPKVAETVSAVDSSITTLGIVYGGRTLVVGEADGGVSTWQVLSSDGGLRLRAINELEPHSEPVTAFAPSRRNKTFLTGADGGTVRFHASTTGKTLLSLEDGSGSVQALSLAPKGNAAFAVVGSSLRSWTIDAPHPEISLRSLFGEVWYEGYPEPARVWQSTGGTDEFEPKLSLTPLIFGTLKGTFYALLIAVPLALFGALYTSQFMHPSFRSTIKPVVEIMAATPSVVLGFLGGLWLAPVVEDHVPAILVLPIVLPGSVILAAFAWRLLPYDFRARIRPGLEVFFLLPVVVLAFWLSFVVGDWVETGLPGGTFQAWLYRATGLVYDQRNSLVVGVAMGFAVIPVIFTVAEEALSSVPRHLVAGSLALGATPWQTAIRVVLPTASPGIFSAVMIGLGRAVGETMIVLMATGNTPIMDWSIFNGFRALSANIAVELPEAPHGGTLYRVLFLSAFILFVMTFLANTLAEVVRLRLREKYRTL